MSSSPSGIEPVQARVPQVKMEYVKFLFTQALPGFFREWFRLAGIPMLILVVLLLRACL